MKQFLIALCIICLAACKSYHPFSKSIYNKNTELLSLGYSKSVLSSSSFETAAFAVLKNNIRIGITKIPFSKSKFKKYTKEFQLDNTEFLVSGDSLEQAVPVYYKVELTDKVAYIKELSEKYNSDLFNYLKQSENIKLVTSIHAVFSKDQSDLLEKSDDCYLFTASNRKVLIKCYKRGKEIGQLDLQESHVFNFKISSFCWGKQNDRNIKIFDIISSGTSCSENTFENANQIKKKRYDFKTF